MDKEVLKQKIKKWIRNFISDSQKFDILKIIESENLSKYNNKYLKKFPNYSSWDFSPDFTIVIKDKIKNNLDLILINRTEYNQKKSSFKTISLRSIGEIMCYNRIVNPKFSFLISDTGHSEEINYFMIDENFRSKLMNYNKKSLIIFSFNDNNDEVNKESVIPFSYRKTLNG